MIELDFPWKIEKETKLREMKCSVQFQYLKENKDIKHFVCIRISDSEDMTILLCLFIEKCL